MQNETEWPKSRQRLMDAARFGFLAGATDIVFHPGSYFGQSPEIVLETALPRLESILKELEEQQIRVKLRPENHGEIGHVGFTRRHFENEQRV